MPAAGRMIALLLLIMTSGICPARAAEQNVGLKRLTLRDPIGGGAMTGFAMYPTAAPAKSVTVG